MKKRVGLLLFSLFFIAVCIISCNKSNNNQNPPPPPPVTCDSVNIKYTADVVPILKTNCYSCHGNGNSEGGIVLDNYSNVNGYASNGSLKGAITHASGYVGMPYLKSKLDSCSINKVIDWINQFAPNN